MILALTQLSLNDTELASCLIMQLYPQKSDMANKDGILAPVGRGVSATVVQAVVIMALGGG
jgi:hypothetical protein